MANHTNDSLFICGTCACIYYIIIVTHINIEIININF